MAIGLAVGALALAGCGDDDDDEGGNAGTAPPAAETNPPADTGGADASEGGTNVSLTDFAIDPANPTATAGKVTYQVSNDGQVPHALEIEGGGEEFETKVLNAGESATLEADLKAGEYEWYCPVGNHAQMGMEGKLTVE
jgi:plastocyanin